jgi:putative copper export protein
MYKYTLLLHILGATIWTGGHIVLATCILPDVLRNKDVESINKFESKFELLGIPALIVQVLTGLWLIHNLLPSVSEWFTGKNIISTLIIIKLSLLLITVILALDSRLRIIPNLNQDNLKSLGYHIIAVTIVSITFVVIGVGFRVGGFW